MSRRPKVFLDTNVLLDVLSSTPRPFSASSDLVFEAIRSGLLEGEISTQSFLDACYIISRGRMEPLLAEKIGRLMTYINVGAIDSFKIREAMLAAKGDFEDDCQFACAMDGGCDAFLTHDKEFINRYEGINPNIQFFTPDEFVARLKE